MTNYRTKKGRELLSKKIEEYFILCDRLNSATTEKKNADKPAKPYTMSGLLFHLDMSAKEFEELSKNRSVCKITSCAKRRIEAYIEEKSLTGELSTTAAFNSLKEHFGWSMKEKQEHNESFLLELSDEAERFGA